MSDTNKPSPVAEPASEPPHRLDSWATECSEPATDKDHLTVAPASAADGLPEPVAKIHSDGYWTEGKSFKEPLNFASMELYTADQLRTAIAAAVAEARVVPEQPIDMILHCPACGMQHIDAPEFNGTREDKFPAFGEDPAMSWTNPPHRSHKCHGCGHIWRPADVPTNGVDAIKTKGKADAPLGGCAAPTPPAEPVETVPWPTVTRYSGGASHEGIGGRVWVRLADDVSGEQP